MFSFFAAAALTPLSLPLTPSTSQALTPPSVAQVKAPQVRAPQAGTPQVEGMPSGTLQAANGYPITRQITISSNEILQPQDVRPLPGSLDSVPVFNSNSPEAIRRPGILLSTFPSQGKLTPGAHLNFPFQGRFDVFAHHIAKTDKPDTTPTLYNSILIYNPSSTKPVIVDVLKAASFLGNPDAPYVNLPPLLDNPFGRVFSGPGGRLTDTLLRSARQTHWPSRVYLSPKQSELLMNLPIPVPRPAWSRMSWNPVSRVTIPSFLQQNPQRYPIQLNTAASSNTRSTMMRLQSNGAIYMAYLALYAPVYANGQEGIPSKSDWENVIINGKLAEPRDRAPSPLSTVEDRFFYYGRVSGISKGSEWDAQITDTPKAKRLTIPEPGDAISYGLSTLPRGTFGTGQIQSAPILARYLDTAFMAHGNYGVHYQMAMPLYNPHGREQQVAIAIQTPVKQDLWGRGLRFFRALPEQVFFRGTVRVRYKDDNDTPQVRFYHINQRQGQQGQPLATFKLKSKEDRLINLDYFYPPDATPPQVLTIQTLSALPSSQQSAYGFSR